MELSSGVHSEAHTVGLHRSIVHGALTGWARMITADCLTRIHWRSHSVNNFPDSSGFCRRRRITDKAINTGPSFMPTSRQHPGQRLLQQQTQALAPEPGFVRILQC